MTWKAVFHFFLLCFALTFVLFYIFIVVNTTLSIIKQLLVLQSQREILDENQDQDCEKQSTGIGCSDRHILTLIFKVIAKPVSKYVHHLSRMNVVIYSKSLAQKPLITQWLNLGEIQHVPH